MKLLRIFLGVWVLLHMHKSFLSAMEAPSEMGIPAEAESAAPSPDTSMQTPPVMDQPAASAESTQLKWPDSIELKEEDKGIIAPTNPKIVALNAQVQEYLNQMNKVVDQITKKREELFSQYFEFDNVTDVFIQSAAQSKGEVQQAAQNKN